MNFKGPTFFLCVIGGILLCHGAEQRQILQIILLYNGMRHYAVKI